MMKIGRLWVALFLTMAACRGGCGRDPDPPKNAARLLAHFPPETRIVVSVDFRSARAGAVWQRLGSLVAEDPKDRKILDELTARTGLDPFKQVHRIVAAFPEEARASGAFGVIIEGEGFDERRLLTYAADQAKLRGSELQQRVHGKRTLWASTAPGGAAGFALDPRRFVIAGGGWAEAMAAIADRAGGTGDTAADNPALVNLCERAGTGRAVWLAAVIPDGTRARLRARPDAGAEASVMRLGASLDLGPRLGADVVAEMSNADDARALAEKVGRYVREAKQNPQLLLLGAGPYLDAITARHEGPDVRLGLALDEAQTSDLLSRLGALARLGR